MAPQQKVKTEKKLKRREKEQNKEDERVKDEAMQVMGSFQLLPKLVVFDLDFTIWPFYCECRSKREMPSLYPDVKGILYALKDKGIDVAIASRSSTPEIAKTILDKLGIQSMFVAQEIFSSVTHKTEHFQRIHNKTKISYTDMLFFDDEHRNIIAVNNMGAKSILVKNGITQHAFRQGLMEFSQKYKASDKSGSSGKNKQK